MIGKVVGFSLARRNAGRLRVRADSDRSWCSLARSRRSTSSSRIRTACRKSWDFFNYTKAWDQADIQTTMRNSLFITGHRRDLQHIRSRASLRMVSPDSASRAGFRLRLVFIGGLVVPVQLIILPIFIMFREMGPAGQHLVIGCALLRVWEFHSACSC